MAGAELLLLQRVFDRIAQRPLDRLGAVADDDDGALAADAAHRVEHMSYHGLAAYGMQHFI